MMYRWEGRGGVKEGRWKSRLALYACMEVCLRFGCIFARCQNKFF